MSRYRVTNEEGETLVYGWDNSLGYWYDLYLEGEDVPELEVCSAFDGLTHGRMLEFINEKDFKLPKTHITAIALDIPF